MLGIHVADETGQWSCHQLSLNHSILFDKYVTNVFQMLPALRWVCCFWKENNKLREELCVWMCVCVSVCVCVCVFVSLSFPGVRSMALTTNPFLVPRFEEGTGLYIYTPIRAYVCFAWMIRITCWFHVHLQMAAAHLKQYQSKNK